MGSDLTGGLTVGYKTAFLEAYNRLEADTEIKTVFKGQREDISVSDFPCAMIFPLLDKDSGVPSSHDDNKQILELDLAILLFFEANDIESVSEDQFDWVTRLKKDISGNPVYLNATCHSIAYPNVFYHHARQMEGDSTTWNEAAVELHVTLGIQENYTYGDTIDTYGHGGEVYMLLKATITVDTSPKEVLFANISGWPSTISGVVIPAPGSPVEAPFFISSQDTTGFTIERSDIGEGELPQDVDIVLVGD
jgi:hypothetical protein